MKRQHKRRFEMDDRAILMRVLGVLFDHERQDWHTVPASACRSNWFDEDGGAREIQFMDWIAGEDDFRYGDFIENVVAVLGDPVHDFNASVTPTAYERLISGYGRDVFLALASHHVHEGLTQLATSRPWPTQWATESRRLSDVGGCGEVPPVTTHATVEEVLTSDLSTPRACSRWTPCPGCGLDLVRLGLLDAVAPREGDVIDVTDFAGCTPVDEHAGEAVTHGKRIADQCVSLAQRVIDVSVPGVDLSGDDVYRHGVLLCSAPIKTLAAQIKSDGDVLSAGPCADEANAEGARLREWVAKVDALVDGCGLLVHNIQQL